MIDLNKLHVFNVVAQAGSFSAAGQQLLLTQPAVSQHIQDLEASLGTRLFVRGRRGVTLTAAGERLADRRLEWGYGAGWFLNATVFSLGIDHKWSKLVMNVLVVIFNYFASKYVIFKNKQQYADNN